MLIARQLHVKCTQNARNCVIKGCQWTFLYCALLLFFLLGRISCKELCSIDACAILRIRQRHLNTIRQQFQCSLSKRKWLSMCESENKSRTKMCVSPATTYTHIHTPTHTCWLSPLSAVKCSRCAMCVCPCVCPCVHVSRILMHAVPAIDFNCFRFHCHFLLFPLCECVCVCVCSNCHLSAVVVRKTLLTMTLWARLCVCGIKNACWLPGKASVFTYLNDSFSGNLTNLTVALFMSILTF